MWAVGPQTWAAATPSCSQVSPGTGQGEGTKVPDLGTGHEAPWGQQGASLQGLAEGRDLSRFVWVGIKEVGIKERQKAVLQQQRSPRASGGSKKV